MCSYGITPSVFTEGIITETHTRTFFNYTYIFYHMHDISTIENASFISIYINQISISKFSYYDDFLHPHLGKCPDGFHIFCAFADEFIHQYRIIPAIELVAAAFQTTGKVIAHFS